jgi:hypothetical protein
MEDQFRAFAQEIAQRAQSRVLDLEREIFDLETVLAKKKAERDSASLAPQRLANFDVKLGTDYQCPSCWIERETRSSLRPTRNGTDTEDYVGCPKCHREFTLKYRE